MNMFVMTCLLSNAFVKENIFNYSGWDFDCHILPFLCLVEQHGLIRGQENTFKIVLQKFLLSIPGGVFSPEGEEILLKTLTIGHKLEQYDSIHE